MKNFEPDYNKCNHKRKEIAMENICCHCYKDIYMYCMITKEKCIAWEGYKHE